MINIQYMYENSTRGYKPGDQCSDFFPFTSSCVRATTYYLADRRYDMLPAVLSADLCSLLGGVDRSVNSTPTP